MDSMHTFQNSSALCAGSNSTIKAHNFCLVCASCVIPDCQYADKDNLHYGMSVIKSKDILIPRSQKLRGIMALDTFPYNLPSSDAFQYTTMLGKPSWITVIQSDEDLEQLKTVNNLFANHNHKKYFARPCPITPKHGFVESREVTSFEGLKAVWEETKQADKDAELLVMRKIEASHNAILTQRQVIIGKGNDGATSGKDAMTFPIVDLKWPKETLEKAQITESPYFEAVFSETDNHRSLTTFCTFVQLRNGPMVEAIADYIPHTVNVTEVISITGNEDLLIWDKKISAIARSRSVVVYHKGGSLACHYGVHCVINNVAYVTSHEPKIGDTLKKITNKHEAKNGLDYRLVQQGLGYALSEEYTKLIQDQFTKDNLYKHSFRLLSSILYCLHNYSVLGKEQSLLLGFAVGSAIRLGIAAGQGEARHLTTVAEYYNKEFNHNHGLSRERVYEFYFHNFDKVLKDLRILYHIFTNGSWQGSYGGANWAMCVEKTIDLFNHGVLFYKRPTKRTFAPVMVALNELINVVHNGGKFLNKFSFAYDFDFAASNPALYTVVVSPALMTIQDHLNSLEVSRYSFSKLRRIRSKLSQAQTTKLETILKDKVDLDVALTKEQYCGDCDELVDDCCCNLDLERS